MRSEVLRDGLLVALAIAAGSVNALSFLGLGQVFTGVMTGNLVLLGLALGHGGLAGLVRCLVALAGYLAGVALASRVVGAGPAPASGWSRRAGACLAVEAVGLAAVAAGWCLSGGHPRMLLEYVLVAVCAISLGTQAVAVRALAGTGISTTYLTSTLTALVTGVVSGTMAGGVRLRVALLVALTAGAALEALLLRVAPPVGPLLPLLMIVAALLAGAAGGGAAPVEATG
ncbi:MAG TPA: DUF1275 family protein [Candidatus Dormibacteraeota bacterium]|jgi:uncharacterized membrane protein YoaK (UPF0700 family)|nr:DUF1275 family protein [Candidatus Dormibacteraeota bacterium]